MVEHVPSTWEGPGFILKMRQVIYSSLNILRSLFHPQSEFVLLQVSGICFKSLPYMSYTVLDEVAVELENSVC